MAEQITLDDVARFAGVSRATASRAINDRPGVRPDVRDRVLRAADVLGFRPNRSARNLASGRSSVIGLVIPSDELRIDPYGASMTHAVGRASTQRDLGLMLHLAADEPGDTVHHILRDGLIDGLLISSVAMGRPWVDKLLDADALPTVLIGTHPTRTDLVGVDVENIESSATVVGHLIAQGCERVATITGPLERADARDRLAGYRLAHERAGRAVDASLITTGDYRQESGSHGAATLLDRPGEPIDGLFAANDQMAIGAMWTLARRGLRVPDDVAVGGFDGTTFEELLQLTLTTMRQPFDSLATAAVDELMRRIGGTYAEHPIVLDPELFVGESSMRTQQRAP